MPELTLTVNGLAHTLDVPPQSLLGRGAAL